MMKAFALLAAVALPFAAQAKVQTGSLRGHSYTASNNIIGQTSTATQAPPTPPGTVGNPIYNAGDPFYSGVVQLVMHEASGDFLCSGSLSADRSSIITAAHCVSDGSGPKHVTALSVTAYFNDHSVDTINYDDPVSVAVPIGQIFVNPLYTGEVIDDHDIAVLRLAGTAPAFARGYDLYTGTDLTGADYNVAGFGLRSDVGGAIGADLNPGRIRQGDNRYDYAFGDPAFEGFFAGAPHGNGFFGSAETDFTYISDFDNGTAAQDGSCRLAVEGLGLDPNSKFCNLGRGATEVSTAPGDSGGPQFIDGKLASVTSFGLSFGTDFGDIDDELNDTFGEFNGFVPIFHNINFINGVPEPSSWSMMIVGFGLIGAVLRSKRAAEPVAVTA